MSLSKLTHTNIIELLGIETLPLEKRKEIVEQALSLVEERSLAKILTSFGDEDKTEFIKLLETENKTEIDNFIDIHKIDILGITEEEVENVKKELVEEAKI